MKAKVKIVTVLLVFTLFAAVIYGVFTATVSIQNEFTMVAGLAAVMGVLVGCLFEKELEGEEPTNA